jgi:hypothetical protein
LADRFRLAEVHFPPVWITRGPPVAGCYPDDMDMPTSPDLSRPAATSRDIDHTLSLDEVAQLYATAGHARTLRTLQRYCASGHLDAQKVTTALGDKYLVTPQSVARHVAQIEELAALDTVAAGRDVSRLVATPVLEQQSRQSHDEAGTTGGDMARQEATGEGESRYVAQLEKQA